MKTRIAEMLETALGLGGKFSFDDRVLRVLNGIARSIVAGNPVSRVQVAKLARAAGIDPATAEQSLVGIAERDQSDNIVGIPPGLTLTPTPHRLAVDGRKVFAWCAEDAVIAAAFLGQTVEIESTSPLRKETVRLTVSANGVESVTPKDAVMSMIVVDTDQVELDSLTAVWGVFCHNIFFFPSRREAEEWARGKNNIEMISPDEAYEIAKIVARAFTASATTSALRSRSGA